MTKGIRIHETGGPEKLLYEDVDVGAPGQGEIRIRHSAIGLNFIDCYQRSGLYPLPGLPLILGAEGAGVVEELGAGVTDLAIGQRVAYAGGQIGSYTEERTMSADVVVPVPDSIDDQTAAAMMLKGMTVYMLLHRCYTVQPGNTVLVHAAAGGVGTIMCQWAKHLGATVIGTVGTEEKAEIAKAHGCDHPILYTKVNFAERVREITGGIGIQAVYDSIGKDTFMDSLDCLEKFGSLVSFGNASGPAPEISPLLLMQKGSLFLNRPTLMNYTEKRENILKASQALFDVVSGGQVKIEVSQTYALKNTAQAHADLEARRTTGCTVLLP